MKFTERFITNPNHLNGRFGTALARIGDIDLDGYNDIAISAPFEGNGVVYIHLGGPNGISPEPSQRIEAPKISPNTFEYTKAPMFGHSISRGVDIDANGYRDIAIGAPNSEVAFIYKTYPVVKVIAQLKPSQKRISLSDTKFNVEVCAYFECAKKINRPICELSKNRKCDKQFINISLISAFIMNLTVDQSLNRVSFYSNKMQSTQLTNVSLTSVEICGKFNMNVRATMKDIFKPITLELSFETEQQIDERKFKFCETCVVLDPRHSASKSEHVTFNTGCSDDKACKPDFTLGEHLINVELPYLLGSTKTITISYVLFNLGEPSYQTQLKVSIPNNITQFSKVPPACQREANDSRMVCDINDGKPLMNGETAMLDVILDSSHLEGESFSVYAQVSSRADDKKKIFSKKHETEIPMREFSDVQLVG